MAVDYLATRTIRFRGRKLQFALRDGGEQTSGLQQQEQTWTDECEEAFEFLKLTLTQEGNILILPDYDAPFRIETDASKYGVGGVLSQMHKNKWHPVSYFSKHLSKTENASTRYYIGFPN